MSRPVTLASVLRLDSVADTYAACVDARGLGEVRFESLSRPTFRVGDLVAMMAIDSPTSAWIATKHDDLYGLCTQRDVGLLGESEDTVFVVEAGLRLRADPTFMVAARQHALDAKANGAMLVVPSFSGASIP